MSSLETNFRCASVRKKSITYEYNDPSKQRQVIVPTLHIEYDFILKVLFFFTITARTANLMHFSLF